jgi:hypothetical protein
LLSFFLNIFFRFTAILKRENAFPHTVPYPLTPQPTIFVLILFPNQKKPIRNNKQRSIRITFQQVKLVSKTISSFHFKEINASSNQTKCGLTLDATASQSQKTTTKKKSTFSSTQMSASSQMTHA